MLQKPTDTTSPQKIADLLEALSQLGEIDDGQDMGDDSEDSPCCPHCGSMRTTFLGEWPRPRIP